MSETASTEIEGWPFKTFPAAPPMRAAQLDHAELWEAIERLNERAFGAGSEDGVSVRTADLTMLVEIARDRFVPLTRQPIALNPDATDIHLLASGAVPACPFDGGTPTTFTKYFEHTGIYQAHVSCSRCFASVMSNAHDRDEARNRAIADWSKRTGPFPAGELADIRGTIEDAAPSWKEQGYFSPLCEVRDMAGVGRALIEVVADVARPGGPLAGWMPADSPVEIVTDLLNKVGDLTQALQQARAAIVQAAKDTLWCDATRPAETVVDLIDATLGVQP